MQFHIRHYFTKKLSVISIIIITTILLTFVSDVLDQQNKVQGINFETTLVLPNCGILFGKNKDYMLSNTIFSLKAYIFLL